MIKQSNFYVKQMEIGPMANFIYFVGDKTTGEVAFIDPCWEIDTLIDKAKQENLKIVAVFLTHGHPDHASGLKELLTKLDVPVYISRFEPDYWRPQVKNLKDVEPDQIIKIGSIEFKCIHTPGHSPGGLCFLAEGCLFSGDTLFIRCCGRTDLPGGNAKLLQESLQQKILKLPDSTIVYPGHNYDDVPFSTLGEIRKINPYLMGNDFDESLDESRE